MKTVEPKYTAPLYQKILIAIAVLTGIILLFFIGRGLMHRKENKTNEKEGSYAQNATSNTNGDNIPASSIPNNTLTIDPLSVKATTIEREEIEKISDSLSQKKELKVYDFTSIEGGIHRFELSDVPQNLNFYMYIYNSNMEKIASNYCYGNGYGITIDLEPNTVYHIGVEQSNNTGSFTINIGRSKQIIDVSEFTKISDSLQFKDQLNLYSYTTTLGGLYRFELSDVPQNVNFYLNLYNSNLEKIKNNYCYGNGYGLTVELEPETTYYLGAEQSNQLGSYTLNIGIPKEIKDITEYLSASDSIQYTDQHNEYQFTPQMSGKYRFGFSSVSERVNLNLAVYNSFKEKIESEYCYGTNSSLSVDLSANTVYYIAVEQGSNCGSYTLIVEME